MKKKFFSIVTAGVLAGTLSFGISASAEEVIVKKGDTLWSIAYQNDIALEQLKEINHLSGHLIIPGQRLNITNQAKKETSYTIVKGDTLTSIAREHDVTVAELLEWNEINNPHLIVSGATLTIGGTVDPVQSKKTKTVQQQANKNSSSQVENEPKIKTETTNDLTVTATAYTASCDGCSGVTSTGINLLENPNQKVISVDPSVIPLGTKVYVEGYGHAIAGDIGGAIKGNKIDVFIPDRQDALNWGVKEVKVTILK
ncbi:LysM peptidoglycan-binding and 3D domain-containing protein [Bacillus suaedae]|uniref:LysM peptidoglycan-binding domain-containing protein n=1 Tax=Halalkalibacter suaedae TaxID=2822140 RepID=A0A940WR00_9BACI|nr:3D domain-containing protein [Bacillus suaedae]MBP3950731.1 LysM peptidoglycan-binding domain-containing protein [Bacillus suaedae]